MNKSKNPKPQFLRKEFTVDGEQFLYDFNSLEGTAIRTAIRNYQLYHKVMETLPSNPKELQLITASQIEKSFYAAIFIAVDKDNKYVPYNEVSPATTKVLQARGKTMDDLREACKTDFLFHSGLGNIELLKQSKDLIEILQTLDTQTRKDVLSMALMADSSSTTISEKSSTPESGS